MRILCAACHQTVELPPTVPPDKCPKCGATMAPPGYRNPVILTDQGGKGWNDGADAVVDYSVRYAGSPAVGDLVEFDRPHGPDGERVGGGVVKAAPEPGTLGATVAVDVGFYPGGRPRVVDIHWQRCRVVKSAAEAERERVADPTYTPTVAEALRHPDAFVEGMTEVGGLPPGVSVITAGRADDVADCLPDDVRQLLGMDPAFGPDRGAVVVTEYDDRVEVSRPSRPTPPTVPHAVRAPAADVCTCDSLPAGAAHAPGCPAYRPAPRVSVVYECAGCRARFAWVPGNDDPFPTPDTPCPKCGGRVREAAQPTSAGKSMTMTKATLPGPCGGLDFAAPELVAGAGLLADDMAYIAAGFPPLCPVVIAPRSSPGLNPADYRFRAVRRASLVRLTKEPGAFPGDLPRLRGYREGDDPAATVYALALSE